MSSRFSALILAGVLSTVFLAGGGFWNKKPPEEWSRNDVVQLLTRSPWSRVVVTVTATQASTPDQNANSPCPCGCGNSPVFEDVFGQGGAIETDVARNPKRVVSATEVLARSTTQRSFTVRFLTASPVRMAMARYAVLEGRFSHEQAARFVSASGSSDRIVVSVGCLDAPPVELQLPAEAVAGAAYLLLKKSGTRIDIEQFLNPLQTEQGEAMFVFPRLDDSLPIVTPDEKEVIFALHLPGILDLEAKFKLKDMIVGGQLEL